MAHAPKCPFQEGVGGNKVASKRMQYEGRFILSSNKFPEGCSEQLSKNVISIMALDSISIVAQQDKTILNLGSALIEKRGNQKAVEVSQQMRLLARVVMETRSMTGSPTASLEDILKPGHFDDLIKCARNLGGYCQKEGSLANKHFKSPSTAVKCGYTLKKAATIIRGQALREKDMEKKNDIDVILQLYDAEWGEKITSPALNHLAYTKHNAPQLFPLTEDLLLLREFLIKNIVELTPKVRSETTKENWRELAEVTLARMVMFNKRRGNYTIVNKS